MRIEFGIHTERRAFTTLGPTPRFCAWATFGGTPGALTRSMRGRTFGFELMLGVNPIRLGWNGVWRFRWPRIIATGGCGVAAVGGGDASNCDGYGAGGCGTVEIDRIQ